MDDFVAQITQGMQNKKGRRIVVADLTGIAGAITGHFVICQGNSPTQVAAIADSVRETALTRSGRKPLRTDGLRNASWVAMDYADVMVHIFLPEARRFYDLEHLWADAKMTELPDID